MKKKADWALKWIEKSTSFAERLVAFAAVEGIFFSGSFCSIYWLNSMCKYIEFVADRLLISLGCPKIYNASNPFPWMEMISMRPKTNFFERKVGEYQKAGVDKAAEDTAFSIPQNNEIDF